jgi:phage baseplate assembly protein W
MARNTRIFSDLDLNFTAHPVTGDITRRYDDNAIKQSVKNLLLTRNFERPFHSEIGSPIRQLLFDNPGPMFNVMLKRAVIDVINNFEPRVNIIDVRVDDYSDANEVYVTLEFTIVNTERPITLELALERTR